MRCQCCDRNLNDFEATRKYKSTGAFADLCNRCVKEMDGEVKFQSRTDLEPNAMAEDEETDYVAKDSDHG